MQPDGPYPSARDEIRASEYGHLSCPSCGEPAGDILSTEHMLLWRIEDGPGPGYGALHAECRDGRPVIADGHDEAVAVMNIALADDFWWRETRALRELGYPV